MLEGKTVNLKLIEKEDLPQLTEWTNRPEFYGEYNPLAQVSKAEGEKGFEGPNRPKAFFIQKKDGTKIGIIGIESVMGGPSSGLEMGYALLPSERGKGYCTEAVILMLDYAFLSTTNVRVQAHTDTRNKASQSILEKTGFKKEGIARKSLFMWGDWRDRYVYSILREEWKEPRVLTRTA